MNERDIMIDLLRGTVQKISSLKVHYNDDFVSGSIAARELEEQTKDYPSAAPAWEAYSLAEARMVSSMSHMVAIANLIAIDISVAAPSNLARSALEISSRACWLLASDISTDQRALRGHSERFYGLREMRKLPIKEIKNHAEARLKAAADTVRGFGLAVELDKNRIPERITGAEAVPAAIDVIRQEGGEGAEVAYRVLSAMAHGVTYGLFSTSRPIASDLSRPGIIYVTEEAGLETLVPRLGYPMLALWRAVDMKIRLYGWNPSDWRAWRDKSARTLRELLHSDSPSVPDSGD